MKRLLSLIVSLLLIISLYGCNSPKTSEEEKNEDSGPVKTFELGEDGIVSKDIFDKVKKNENILYIKGISGSYNYQWAVFGNKLSETKDTVMSVSVEKKGDGVYEIVCREALGFIPSLSVSFPEIQTAYDAIIYDSDNNPLGSATINDTNGNISISFYTKENVKEYKVVFSFDELAEQELETAQGNGVTDGNEGNSVSGFVGNSDYLNPVGSSKGSSAGSSGKQLSSGNQSGKDKYNTDPVPEGKPLPVEPEDQEISDNILHCTISISCKSILNNLDLCDPEKIELVPSDGWILKTTRVEFNEGESVFDVLSRVTREYGIHMESSWTPIYNSAYIEGINNLYEFDVGELSGWMYKVNGWFANYGCSRYVLSDGDEIAWVYTCDLGYDVGGGYMSGG